MPSRRAPAETPALYADALVYDVLHTPGTAEDVATVERIAARHAPGAPRVWLEPACGSGRCLRLAARRGRRVIGIDLDAGMIAYARRRAAEAGLGGRSRYIVADMRDFSGDVAPGSVGVAFNLINTIRHLHTDRDMLEHFAQVARALHPRGIYVVGLSLAAYGVEPPSEDVWEGARGRLRVQQVVSYEPPDSSERLERVISVVTAMRPRGEAQSVSSYALRAYDPGQWRRLVGRSALETAAEVDETGAAHPATAPGYSFWVLRARASKRASLLSLPRRDGSSSPTKTLSPRRRSTPPG
jgi:SAM-dependent methyltransferase